MLLLDSYDFNMAAPRPGNEERAWNDPPLFSYNATPQPPSSTPRTALNKRVPFPVTTTGSLLPASDATQSDKNVVLLPPKVTSNAPETCPVASVIPATEEVCDQEESNDTNAVSEELNIDDLLPVLTVLNRCLVQCENSLQKRTVEEVRRRLGVLEVMWNENKFDSVIKKRMHQLGKDLECGNYDDANRIHLGLIVDYPGQVTPWMVGVKHLIHQSRSLGLNCDSTTLETSCSAD